MTEERPQDVPEQQPAKTKKRRWGKLFFLLLFLIVAGWIVLHQRTHTLLGDWDHDLQAALRQAEREDRQIVAVIYDSANDYTFTKLQGILVKPGNVKAMKEANVIRIVTSLSEDDPLAAKYSVRTYPTTLLISPAGESITAWTGYIGETDFRRYFLKGEARK